MSEKPPPEHIKKAIKAGDTEKLRAAGRKGAEVTNKIKAQQRIEADVLATATEIKALEAEIERQRAANEHIITPDGDDLDWNPDNTPK